MVRGILGFDSLGSFLISTFGLKYAKLNVIFAFGSLITAFITNYIWDSAAPIYVLWIIMGFDLLTGIIKSIKQKNFTSYKLPRILVQLISSSVLLALAFNVAKHSIFFFPLPALLLGGFYATSLISVVENLAEIGYLDINIVRMIRSRFGFKKFLNKNKEQ